MPNRRFKNRGVTMMELLLALAILVMVAALAAPALRSPLSNHRLRKSGDTMRIAFNRARVRAMKLGMTHVVRFQPQGNVYQIDVWQADDANLETPVQMNVPAVGANDLSQMGQQDGSSERMASDLSGVPQHLPDGIQFAGGNVDYDQRSAGMAEELQEIAGSAWSAPILFYADGTTSDANVFMINETGLYIQVHLRGLTGIAEVTDILDETELPLSQ